MSGFGLLGLLMLLIMFMLFLLNIASSVWAYRDARRLGKNNEYALLVLVGTIVFPVVGFIIYLVIRKD
ncbi:PLDc N-terminal domain-containing protein [Paenibacillus sp. NPDC057967]|uniref:PLDc N-terminal domain-containing protein n=1 Tax=Paenibacillus sp. NPDC057967 TaxID=3346293 RepID=UPI0036D7784C